MTRAARRSAMLLAAVTAAAAARADEDHVDVRGAWMRGEIVALAEILPRLETRTGARLIDVELERWRGGLVYEIVMITPDGRLLDVIVDAATGELFEGGGYRWGRRGDDDDDRPGRHGEGDD